MTLRRLHPDPVELTAEQATSGLRLAELAPAARPYVVLNMVATLDGRIAIDGRSGPIGNRADRDLFHGLRTQADAVMVGAGTARSERYGRLVKSDELRERRRREGLRPDAVACIVSGRLDVPPDLPLLQDRDAEVLVMTGSDEEPPDAPARCECVRGERDASGSLVLAPLLRELRARHGIRSILCEGGPTLNAQLFREELVDELWLALAPKLAGGEPRTLLSGEALRPPREFALAHVLESEGHLFMRYRRGA